MPKFTTLDPATVRIGRQREAHEARQFYLDILESANAGAIDLEPGENPAVVKRRLRESAKLVGLKVRSGWQNGERKTLVWKRV